MNDQEAGALRLERDLLLRKVLAVHAGLADGTATAAWRDLLKTALWMRQLDGQEDVR